jgi:hypothetical protein
MSLQVKTTNLIIRRTSVLFSVLLGAVLALQPISADAQCSTGWDASGEHVVRQRGTYPFHVTLQQKGRVITGTASATVERGDGGVKTITGPVDGTIDGNSFRVQIFWNNQQTGVYNATVLPSGRLDGEAYEKKSPNVRPTWNTDGVLKCTPAAPVAPKVIRSSGKAKPPAAQPKPPFVLASQAIFPTPYVPTGFVILTWDGGPDHPNAELWFKAGNGQAPFLKLAKGGHQLPVERGRLYEYVLMDAGKTLSTVRFVAQ